MKIYILFLLLFINLKLFSQQQEEALPINIGYYGAYAIQPGIKIGSTFKLREWSIEEDGRTKLRSLFISPQVGVFIRPGNNTNFILNGDVGYQLRYNKQSIYIAPAVGLGYLISSQILSQKIDLSNGEVIGKSREIRHYFLPTINLEFGKEPKRKFGWYSKLSFGRKISSRIENSTFFALELGLKFILKRKNNL